MSPPDHDRLEEGTQLIRDARDRMPDRWCNESELSEKGPRMSHADTKKAVLHRIALINGVDVSALSLGAKGAVLCRVGNDLKCLCQQGSRYWIELEATILAEAVIKRACRT
jgi:hypothetical protein